MPAGHPPAPWRLVGSAVLVPALVRPGVVGGLLLGDYDSRSTLAYHELLGIQGITWSALLPAVSIPVARVDDDASVAGGRAIWGIPKQPATFAWTRSAGGVEVAVSDAAGEVVTVVAASRRAGRSLPLLGRFAGSDGRPAWVLGRLRGAPARVRVHLPAGSPLAGMNLRCSPVGLLGEVSLRVGAPRSRSA